MDARIAIVHYHLRTAGVTSVIQRASAVLRAAGAKVCVLSGDAPPRTFSRPEIVAPVPALRYGSGAEASFDAAALFLEAREAAAKILGAPPDLWHIHNHALGKNLALPLLVRYMAERGEHLFLQMHDFAEDGRPANYKTLRKRLARADLAFDEILYPDSPRIHYAVLNARDRDFLLGAGAAPDRLHLLPNAVKPLPALDPPDSATRFFLYLTTAIRRKNLGEFLLLAALDDKNSLYGVSQKPGNPAALPIYEKWQAFAQSLDLPVEFECGRKARAFPELVARCRACVTTSVAEGFGLAFLEPWPMNRPLFGRLLPEILSDFEENGLDLSTLYRRLDVPCDWLDRHEIERRVEAAMRRTQESYGRSCPPGAVRKALETAVRGDCVDFGFLDEALQEEIIAQAWRDTGKRDALREAVAPFEIPDRALLEKNACVVRERYGEASYGEKLSAIYRRVLGSPAGAARAGISSQNLLDRFLAPERFTLLRAD